MTLANNLLRMFTKLRMKLTDTLTLVTTDDNKQYFRPSNCKHRNSGWHPLNPDKRYCKDCGLTYIGYYEGKFIWSDYKKDETSKLPIDIYAQRSRS